MIYTNDFQELLKEIKQYNKLDFVAQGLQTKYAREMSGDDDEARRKDAQKTNELLEKILVALTGGKQKSSEDKPEKKFSLKEDFAKFKSELQDGLMFVKKGIIGAATLNEKVHTKVGGAFSSSDSPNIRDSPAELLADETEKQTQTINNLLSTTTESLTTLKKIGFILEGSSEQIKLDQEENKTSKEVLTELKKLNQITAENVAAGGGGSGVNVDIGGTGDADGKKKKGRLGRALGTLRGATALGATAATAAIGIPAALLGGLITAPETRYNESVEDPSTPDEASGPPPATARFAAPTPPAAAAAAPPAAAAPTPPAAAAAAPPAAAAPTPPASKVGSAIAATAAAPSASKKSGGVSADEGDANLQELQMAQGGLQELYREMRNEKAKVTEALLRDKKRFPDGIVDDPSDPEYPKELKAIDDKYKKLIDNQKKEIEKLSKAPGIKQAKAREKAEDDRFFGDEKEMAPAKTKSKVTGEKTKTTTETTVSGGGSETMKMVLSEDAKKAEAEGPAMSKRHQAEYSELRGKLESEGKLEGKSRREIMNMPEIKELRARQDAEQEARGRRVTDGMTYEVSKTSGENAAMRDEISGAKGGQTAVMNNVSNNNTTTYMPIKGEPRPGSRGSALDNYNNRVASY